MSLALAAVTGILFAAGTWLLLQRRLTRIIIGIGLLGHGANLLLVTCLLYTSPSPRDPKTSRMPSSA